MQPLTIVVVGYITGELWGQYFNINIVPIIFLFIIGFYLLAKKKQATKNKKIILFLIISIISNLQITHLENKHNTLYHNLQRIEIEGCIIEGPKESTYKKAYTIKVEKINQNAKYKNTKLIIYTPKNENIEYGRKIKVIGEFTKPNKATNYKAFDYANYLKTKNIYGTVKTEKIIQTDEVGLNWFKIQSNKLKNKIEFNLDEILGENSELVKRNIARKYRKNRRRHNRRF
ncbi:MAG: DUF4131 domain-containing protein [Clostridia bacterium]|jgi:predicted membrane metal-binding protein|nr:DUF4131 domain-containing protein [Clostridia bacterium]